MTQLNADSAPELEPRILEAVVGTGYRLLGGEKLWLAGVISSLLWALGGWCPFLLARRLASDLAAWIALAIHLFLPWGVVASRTFQPDPAMVAALLAYLLALVRFHDRPTRANLLATAGLAAVATVIKPVAVFVVLGAFVALCVHGQGSRRRLLGRHALVFMIVALGPPTVFYGYRLAIGAEAASFVGTTFIPDLITQQSYWSGWSRAIGWTVSWPLLALAMSSIAVARRRDARYLAGGMLVGYLLLGLVFNYHIHTHDYYSLPLVSIVGAGVAFTVDAAWTSIRRLDLHRLFRAVTAGALVVLGLGMLEAGFANARRESTPSTTDRVRRSQAIGAAVGHSTRTLMVTDDYGSSLSFEGRLAGVSWPTTIDFRALALQGKPIPSARKLFSQIRPAPDWFVITALDELDAQPGLQALLDEIGEPTMKGDGYLVYDLRRGG